MNVNQSLENLFSLSGKVAFVTGGGTGIGRTMSQILAKVGAFVVVTSRREELLIETVKNITAQNGQCAHVTADLSQTENISGFVEQATKPFGFPDILVNAAGVNLREPVEKITPEIWEQTLAINLRTPFFLAQLLVPEMQRKSWGRIINLASLQSQRAFPNSMPYGASKGGVAQLTRAMAEAWSNQGICCNAIAPGFFPTAMTETIFNDPERAAYNAKQTAIGRNGELCDLEGITVFLASPASDYITGQTIYVDGGFTAK